MLSDSVLTGFVCRAANCCQHVARVLKLSVGGTEDQRVRGSRSQGEPLKSGGLRRGTEGWVVEGGGTLKGGGLGGRYRGVGGRGVGKRYRGERGSVRGGTEEWGGGQGRY